MGRSSRQRPNFIRRSSPLTHLEKSRLRGTPLHFLSPIFCARFTEIAVGVHSGLIYGGPHRELGSILEVSSSGLQDLHDKQALSRISQKRDYGGPPPKLVNMADRRTFERLSDRAVHRREIDALQQTYLARQRDFQGSPNSGASQICSPSERRGPAPCPGILGRVSPGAGP